jgi:nucleoside-diphosphate-sugar epimerase
VIGGTRFMGYQLTWRLIAAGHEVTLLNRGTHPDPFGDRVARLRADRTRPELASVLAGRTFDGAVDFAAFQGADASGAIAALGGRVGHYVMISTGQVYLVKAEGNVVAGPGDPPRAPSREEDYDGPLMAAPPVGHRDRGDWEYGVGKRACEDVLAASPGFPSTRLRIPIVNGERDNTRRLEGYVWRSLDGGPLLRPDGGPARVRQVYSGAVVTAILRVLGDPATFGQAYNLCQQETPTLAELVVLLAELLGAGREARLGSGRAAAAPDRLVTVPTADLEAAGLDPVAASPFSTRWKSFLDPGRAVRELGFVHPPLRSYLERVVSSLLAGWREDPPAGYAQRPLEIALAAGRS